MDEATKSSLITQGVTALALNIPQYTLHQL